MSAIEEPAYLTEVTPNVGLELPLVLAANYPGIQFFSSALPNFRIWPRCYAFSFAPDASRLVQRAVQMSISYAQHVTTQLRANMGQPQLWYMYKGIWYAANNGVTGSGTVFIGAPRGSNANGQYIWPGDLPMVLLTSRTAPAVFPESVRTFLGVMTAGASPFRTDVLNEVNTTVPANPPAGLVLYQDLAAATAASQT